MIERLARALQHIEELPPELQEEIAIQIEEYVEPLDVPFNAPPGSLAGSMPDLPDDAEEELLRLRRSASPTPPIEEQLRWLEED